VACLDDELILDLAERRRPMDGASQAHLASCAECRRVFAAVARGAGDTLREGTQGDDPASEPAWSELGQGVVVDRRYELEAFLGAGGMGIVWRARRLDDGTPVALKIARAMDADLWKRLEREAQVAAALSHPNIARTLDVLPATAERGPVIVYELLEGETLASRLAREHVLPFGEGYRVLVDVALALEAAHARGVVHRDLKPQNVFLAGPRVVVLDFGLAKLTSEWGAHSRLTRTGAVLGSPRYMAPEQIFAEEIVDARADVWALAAVLMTVFTGRAPIEASSAGEAMKALRRGDVADLGALLPAAPEELLGLARAALKVDRRERLASVTPLRDVLSRFAGR
jgi:serine/threonine-protein kinase